MGTMDKIDAVKFYVINQVSFAGEKNQRESFKSCIHGLELGSGVSETQEASVEKGSHLVN